MKRYRMSWVILIILALMVEAFWRLFPWEHRKYIKRMNRWIDDMDVSIGKSKMAVAIKRQVSEERGRL